MWRYKKTVVFLADLLLFGGIVQFTIYAQTYLNLPWRFEAISLALFFMHIGSDFVKSAGADSQSTPRQFLSKERIANAALTSFGITILLEVNRMKAEQQLVGFILVSAIFMLSFLTRRYSRRNLLVFSSTWIIGAAAIAISHYGILDKEPDRRLAATILCLIALFVLLALTDWEAPSFSVAHNSGSSSGNATAIQ